MLAQATTRVIPAEELVKANDDSNNLAQSGYLFEGWFDKVFGKKKAPCNNKNTGKAKNATQAAD